MKKTVLFVVAFAMTFFAAGISVNDSTCTPGSYTANVKAARTYAQEVHRFIFLIQGQNDGGCAMCNQSSQLTYGKTEFLDWSRENDIPLVYGDYKSNTANGKAAYAAAKAITGQTGFPQAAVSDEFGKGIGWFSITAGSVKKLEAGNFLKFLGGPDSAIDSIHKLIEFYDNTYQKANKLGVTDNESIFGIYADYGTNTLRAVGAKIYRYTDYADWFVITNTPSAGFKFQLGAIDVYDPAKLAQVAIYDTEADAKAESNPVAQLTLEEFSKTPLLLDVPNGATYIKIYRRDDMEKTDDVVINYRLKYKQVLAEKPTYIFEKTPYEFDEKAGEVAIPVIRSSTNGAASVRFSVLDWQDAEHGIIPAKQPKDFEITQASVDFSDGEYTNYIKVAIQRGSTNIVNQARAFELILENNNLPEQGSTNAVVCIVDSDTAPQEDLTLNATEKVQLQNGNLDGTKTVEVYCMTNPVAAKGSIYSLKVNPVSPWAFTGGAITVSVKRVSNQKILSEKVFDEKSAPLEFFWGTESDDGVGDTEVVFSRGIVSGEFATVRYTLAWRRYDRPEVSIATDDAEYKTAETDRVFQVAIKADGLEAVRAGIPNFANTVSWVIADAAQGEESAVRDTDYRAADGSLVMTSEITNAVLVTLPKQEKFSQPDRSFRVLLQQCGDEQLFALGTRNAFTCKLLMDECGNGETGSKDAPLQVVAPNSDSTDWATTGEDLRDLSYTCTNDWIKFSNVRSADWDRTTKTRQTVSNALEEVSIVTNEFVEVPTPETLVTNAFKFSLKVRVAVTNLDRTVHADGSVTTNDTEALNPFEIIRESFETNLVVDAEVRAKELKNLWIGKGIYEEIIAVDSKIAQRYYYRLKASDLSGKPVEFDWSQVKATVWTNGVESAYSYSLADLVVADDSAPLLSFDELKDRSITICVSRPANLDVAGKYKLQLRAWIKPEIRFDVLNVTTNDTAASFVVGLTRTGNVADAFEVKVSTSNLTDVAGLAYFSVPDTVAFGAGATQTTLPVTVTNPDWNALNWTGDRSFKLTLGEIYPVGAMDFPAPSNALMVVLIETNMKPLDPTDPADDVFENVATNGAWAIAIDPEGLVTNAIGQLNGRTDAAYSVNDTNDWLRFSGIAEGETYCFKLDSFESNNADVMFTFWSGTNGTKLAEMAGSALLKDGYRYTAETNLDVFVSISRNERKNQIASVRYALSVYRYEWPVVGFDVNEIEITNTCVKGEITRVPIKITKEGNTNETVEVRVRKNTDPTSWSWNLFKDDITPSNVVFTTERNQSTNVELQVASVGTERWTGDWTCNVWLNVNADKIHYGDITNLTVTVVGCVGQKDATDPSDDTRDGAVVLQLSDSVAVVTNHLNGFDVAHEGVIGYTDTNDWFRIGEAKGGHGYRVQFGEGATFEIGPEDVFLEVVSDCMQTNLSSALLKDGQYLEIPCEEDGDEILIRVYRKTLETEVPVSVNYELLVTEVPWPEFDISAEKDTVKNNAGFARAVVTRTKGDRHDTVCVSVEDDNEVAVVAQLPFATNVVFETDETKKIVEIPLVTAEPGYWKRGGDFKFVLSTAEEDPYVSLGETNAIVTVEDSSGIPENDYPDDDKSDGAQTYAFYSNLLPATNYVAEGQSSVWLNGNDLQDWYCFTNVVALRKYRFKIADCAGVNTDGLTFTMTVYPAVRGASGYELLPALGSTNLLEVEQWDVSAPALTDALFVKVERDADRSRDVSFHYQLSFSAVSLCFPQFVTVCGEESPDRVSERASEYWVDVECVMPEGGELEDDVVALVTPTAIESLNPAQPNLDYNPKVQTVTWLAGSTGGVQRVCIPLCNFDNDWRGDRTFKLVMTGQGEGETTSTKLETYIKIVEKDAPIYGTVAMTTVNGVTLSKNTQLAVREGDDLLIDVALADGIANAVTGIWTFAVGKTKTTVERPLFAFGDRSQSKTVEIPVPVTAGFQLEQSATVTFSLKTVAKTVTLAKSSVTSFKLSIADILYAGKVSDVGAADSSKCTFRASESDWFLDAEGAYRSAVPAAGGSLVLRTTVTGPGVLSFDAEVPSGCTLRVSGGVKVVDAEDGENEIVVTNGTRTLTFVLSRPRTGATSSASASVDNVVFTPGATFNLYGTFVGAVRHTVGQRVYEGVGTLTVAQNGRFSGKFQCADGTWTFSESGGWNEDNTKTVTAKCGTSVREVLFSNKGDGSVSIQAEGTIFSGELVRNAWRDKPLTAANAELIGKAAGYYTMTLPSDDPEDAFGSGYLTGTIGVNGSVKITGVLADGKAISLTSTLYSRDGTGSLRLYTAPSAYKKGYFAAEIGLDGVSHENGCVVDVESAGSLVNNSANAIISNGLVRVVGGYYDKTENLYEHYKQTLHVGQIPMFGDLLYRGSTYEAAKWAGCEEVPVFISFNETGTRVVASETSGAQLFTMNFTPATGIFSGYLRGLYDVNGRNVKKSTSYRGVITPYKSADEGEDSEGRGFFLMNSASYDFSIRAEK